MMTSLIDDKRKDKVQMVHTHWNPKRHMPLVSLLLWLDGGRALVCLASSLATVVRLADKFRVS